MPARKIAGISPELLDQLLGGADAKPALDKDGLSDELKKALAERALNAEMDHHLEAEAAEGQSNRRNGYGKKTVLTETGRSSWTSRATGRELRSATDRPLSAALPRRRREDRVDVRARHEHPRDPGPPARALRPGGLAR